MDNCSSCTNGVLVLSCDDRPPENVIRNILDVDKVPDVSVEFDHIKGYNWMIKTKYYTAEATVYSIKDKKDLDQSLLKSIQAIVFYFNDKEHSSFENVISWMPLLKDVTSEVQLLICENCSHEETCKKNILNWCIENQFELVELQEKKEEGDGDSIKNCYGYQRVREALHTCSWPNIVLTSNASNTTKESNIVECEATGSDKKSKPEEKLVDVDNEEIKLQEDWLQNVLEQDEAGEESFEALFAKFASMKDQASRLDGDDRKKYAEKVAIAFCKAMGCEDEIEGLDND